MNPRQAKIIELVRANGEATVADLAARFAVTPMTIRRDLAALQERGDLTRTCGGAMPSVRGTVEFKFLERSSAMTAQKQAIAKRVVELVQPNTAICLDTGTTTLEVARLLAAMRGVKVLTSSLAIAAALFGRDGVELVLLGGTARRNSPDLFGDLTVRNLEEFRVETAILGADALAKDGLYTTEPEVARVSRAMMAAARVKVLAADSSKFEGTGFVRFAGWRDIDVLVTDAGVPRATRRWLGRKVRKVEYAAVEG